MNSTGESEGEMGSEKKPGDAPWISFVIIAICLALTQAIAYLATPQKIIEERKYVLNILAFYTIAVQWIVFIHAGGFLGNERTEKYYDLTGSLTYLSALALSLILINGRPNTRQIILSTFVAVWSIRLGWFLFARIHNNNGVDSRFTEMKKSTPRFLMAWTLQGVWVFLTMIPVLLLNQSIDSKAFGTFDYIGIPLWAIGFLIEIISDFQKSAFRKLAENKEKWIQSGLWSSSRHPNYFGEITLWVGVALCSFGGLGATPRAAFAFISPCFVALLLIFVSGIPLLEDKADNKFGDNSDYRRYKENTPTLIPFIGRRGNAMF